MHTQRGRNTLIIQDEKWYKSYAEKILTIKGHQNPNQRQIENLQKRIKKAFRQPYHAVALDIDGTITQRGSLEIDKSVIPSICKIISTYVTVVLITGRGRKSARKIADSLRKLLLECDNNLSRFIFRRLHCITHNGAYLLSSTTEIDIDFLKHESILEKKPDFLDDLKALCEKKIGKKFNEYLDITKEPVGIRIVPKSYSFDKFKLREICKNFFNSIPEKWRKSLNYIKGIYGESEVIEFTSTHKGKALSEVSKLLGIPRSYILRIGDQGKEGFNDYELLNSPYGFSVGSVSKNLYTCFPVLEKDKFTLMEGAYGVAELLKIIHLTPAISLKSPDSELYYSRLLRFEQLAKRRAKIEVTKWNSILSSRIKYLEVSGDSSDEIQYEDFIDKYTGAVRLKVWEMVAIDDQHPLKQLFSREKKKRFGQTTRKGFYYSMFTDTAKILRGPFYYYPLAFEGKDLYFDEYLDDCNEFINESRERIRGINQRSLDNHRLLLGVMDNVRNILIITGYAIFRLALEDVLTDRNVLIAHYKTLVEHTDFHVSEFLDPFPEGFSFKKYREHLASVSNTVKRATELLRANKNYIKKPNDYFRKWRETDNFIENLLSVQLALREFSLKIPDMCEKATIVYGIAYGGFELPAICTAIGSRLGIKVYPAMTCYQSYKAKKKTRKDTKSNHEEEKPLFDCFLGESKDLDLEQSIYLLADDNLTTARTLHKVRDRLEQKSKHISGIIVVWYPSEKRFAQMQMKDHGGPDTDLFFTYIRGLIASAPYTRIIQEGPPGSEYLDETGIFNKARHRICRYLYRNNLYNSKEIKSHAPRSFIKKKQ